MLKENSIGRRGEDLACLFLMKQGYKVLERNHLQKWGELDIIGLKDGVLNFFEVKTVQRDLSVTHVTRDYYRPEDNIHPWKVERLKRVVQTYLLGKGKRYLNTWRFNIVTVVLDKNSDSVKVDLWEDVIL